MQDVVAPSDGSTRIAGEAKFTSAPLGYDVLSGLEDDVEHIDWTPTGGGEPTYEFALFGRSGFKRSVEEAADERDDLRLFDLSEIVAVGFSNPVRERLRRCPSPVSDLRGTS
nr:hypothetical protein [Halopenitus persicus]